MKEDQSCSSEDICRDFIPLEFSDNDAEGFDKDAEISEIDESSEIQGITAGTHSLSCFGTVYTVIQRAIVVAPKTAIPRISPNTPLFNQDASFLGIVKEPFGPVTLPFYVVKLSKAVETSTLGEGKEVFWCPDVTTVLPDIRQLMSETEEEGEYSDSTCRDSD